MNAQVQSDQTNRLPIALVGLALGASIALHFWLIAEVQALRPATYELPFRDSGIIFECPLANCGPERLFRWPVQPPAHDDRVLFDSFVDPLVIQGRGEGWATVRCQVTGKQYLDHCKWIAESAPGFGDRALAATTDARPTRRLEPGSTIQLKVRFEGQPYAIGVLDADTP